MAIVPTPEESAKRILAIFRRHDVRAEGTLMAGALNVEFLTRGGGTADEYREGMEFALAENSIEIEPNMVRLKEAGFAAM